MSHEKSTPRRGDLPLVERLRLPLLVAKELAVHLALPDARSVHRMARRREIPFVQVGGRHLFRLDAVVEALWKIRVEPMSEAEIRARIAAIAQPRRRRSPTRDSCQEHPNEK